MISAADVPATVSSGAPSTDARPRILFLARSCNIHGMLAELIRRSDTYYCPANSNQALPAGTQLFTLRAAYKMREKLRAGEYDLVISSFIGDTLWRREVSWWRNGWKVARKLMTRPESLGPDLVPWMLKGTDVPLAVFDWEDNLIIPRRNWGLLERATCYFKTQTPRNPYKAFLFQDVRNDCLFNIVREKRYRDWAHKLRPLSLGVTPPEGTETIEPQHIEKTTDVFFAGAMGYAWEREVGRHKLAKLRDEGYRIDLHCITPGVPSLPQDEFLRRCSQAWLVWSPEGAGWDCMRHYWAPLIGSVPLMNHPDTHRYMPLTDGINGLYYAVEGDDIQRVVRMALQDKEKLRAMAAAGRDFVLQYHTHARLADYLIAETLRTAKAPATSP
ncbi:hypothetical protein DB346_25175 [Verrucomicrobia bacterium LW23]|nr:hypothetical protein DB346_25175 [Verrucomicrobia bacterium LW23]